MTVLNPEYDTIFLFYFDGKKKKKFSKKSFFSNNFFLGRSWKPYENYKVYESQVYETKFFNMGLPKPL